MLFLYIFTALLHFLIISDKLRLSSNSLSPKFSMGMKFHL